MIGAYNGIQSRANDSAVQGDLSSAAKVLEMFRVDNSVYPTGAQLGTVNNRLKFSKNSYQVASNAVLYCLSADSSKYALLGKSKSDKTYIVSSSRSSPSLYTGTFPGSSSVVCSSIDADLGAALWVHSGSGWSGAVD